MVLQSLAFSKQGDDRHDNLRFGANWAAKCIPAIGGTAVLWRRDRLHLEGEDRHVWFRILDRV